VFALSARRALAARMAGDDAALAASRLPALESALLSQLLPQRSQVIGRMVEDGLLALQHSAQRRVADRQHQNAEQLAELRSLRGKSSGRLQLISARLDGESAEFERCGPRLVALRSVLTRQVQALLEGLSGETLRLAVRRMREGSEASFLRLGAARAFANLREQLKTQLADTERGLVDIDLMLRSSVLPLNAEFGFSLNVPARPVLDEYQRELDRIEAGYGRYLGITQVWRLAQADFSERFTRLLLSRLRVVFEGAANEIEVWSQSAGTQIDEQLRERRRMLAQRREAHGRVRTAEDGLEHSIQGLEAQEMQLRRLGDGLAADVDSLRLLAATPPVADAAAAPANAAEALRQPRLQLVAGAAALLVRGAA
jgi:hypothetical protein